jgi:hypothetical protein
MFLTFDVMGLVGFGKDFHQLENATEHSAIRGLHDQMAALGLLSGVPWLLSFLGSIPGLSGSYGLFMEYCGREVQEKKTVEFELSESRILCSRSFIRYRTLEATRRPQMSSPGF